MQKFGSNKKTPSIKLLQKKRFTFLWFKINQLVEKEFNQKYINSLRRNYSYKGWGATKVGAKKDSGKLTALFLLITLISASITIAFAETDANADFNQAVDSSSNQIGSGIPPAQDLGSDSNNNAIAEKENESINSQIDPNFAENSNSNQLIDANKENQFTAKEGFATIIAIAEPTFSQNSAQAPDSNAIGTEVYSSNLMFCSNLPTGQYCENWEASCSQTTWQYPNTAFYIYMRVYDIFHNNNYDYTIRIDADNPNREDIRWWNGSEWVDHLLYRYQGTGNWAYRCNAFGILLPTPTGQWMMKIKVTDNITSEWKYYTPFITIKCDNDTHCLSSQACRSNQCIECTSHAYSKCANNDLYWFDSCDRQQEMKEDCRVSCEWLSGQGYYCSNGLKGNWNVQAFDLWRNGKPNATVQYKLRDGKGWQFAGQTDSSGKLQFSKILLGPYIDLKAISAEGANCGEKYGFIEKENDTDTYFFLCPETKTNNQLYIAMSSNKKEYQQGESIQFSFNVKDNAGANVEGAFIGIILPNNETTTSPLTGSSGNSSLALTATGEGTQKIMAVATKVGYKSNSAETTVLVKEKPKTVIEVKGTNQQPVPRATIYINSAPAATTNATGKAVITMPKGTNKIEVEVNQRIFASTQINPETTKSMDFIAPPEITDDADGDGWTDEEERIFGSDPLDPNDNFCTALQKYYDEDWIAKMTYDTFLRLSPTIFSLGIMSAEDINAQYTELKALAIFSGTILGTFAGAINAIYDLVKGTVIGIVSLPDAAVKITLGAITVLSDQQTYKIAAQYTVDRIMKPVQTRCQTWKSGINFAKGMGEGFDEAFRTQYLPHVWSLSENFNYFKKFNLGDDEDKKIFTHSFTAGHAAGYVYGWGKIAPDMMKAGISKIQKGTAAIAPTITRIKHLLKLEGTIVKSATSTSGLKAKFGQSANAVYNGSRADLEVIKVGEAASFAEMEKQMGATLVKTESQIISGGSKGADYSAKIGGKVSGVSVKTVKSTSTSSTTLNIAEYANALEEGRQLGGGWSNNILHLLTKESNYDTVLKAANSALLDYPGTLKNKEILKIMITKVPDYLIP